MIILKQDVCQFDQTSKCGGILNICLIFQNIGFDESVTKGYNLEKTGRKRCVEILLLGADEKMATKEAQHIDLR